MKQIFYGHSGYGKSHLILHGIISKKKVVVISACGAKNEFNYVGLSDVPLTSIPLSLRDTAGNTSPEILIQAPDDLNIQESGILGFDVNAIPQIYEEATIHKITEWLENMGISDDHEYTIVFIDIAKEIHDPVFVKRITKWNADIVVEHICYQSDAPQDLEIIRKTGEWFEVPIYVDMHVQQK